jgi:outer membrane protein insertion porin family
LEKEINPLFIIFLLVFPLVIFPLSDPLFAQDEIYGPRAWEVGDIIFTGNSSVSDGDLKDVVELEEGKDFLEWQLQDDMDAIRSHYVSKGFIDASVSEEREVRLDVRKVDVEFVIYEGQKTYVSGIEVRGARLLSTKEVQNQLKVKVGDPLDINRIEEFEVRLKDNYARRGYPYIIIDPDFHFSDERDSVEILLVIDEGKLTTLGELSVVGNERVDEELILRMLTIDSGDIFNPEKLQESQENVYQIGLFKSVFFDIQGIDEEADTLDLVIEVREDDFRSLGFGLGYGSAQGIRASGEWGYANILDRAEKIVAGVEWTYQPSEQSAFNRTSSYALSLSEPVFLFTNARSQWTASYQDFDYRAFDKVGISGGLLLSRFYGRKKRISLQFLVESSDISEVEDTQDFIPEDILRNVGKHLRSSLELSYVRDKSDDIFNPTRGEVLKLITTMAGGPLIGERDYYRLIAEYAIYKPSQFLGIDMIMASHLKVGLVKEFGKSEPVPPEEQFAIGGANSLRGYKELSIGLISEDEPRPGNYLIQFNLEGRFHIWRGLDGVLFFDMANIYDNDFHPRRPFLLSTGGIGLRYRTPIGPVRVEQAVRLDSNFGTDAMKGRLHISIGNPF